MPSRLVLAVTACLSLCSLPAFAGARVIAVLPLDVSHTKGKLDADARASIEEMLRDVAVETLGHDGWTVLTGENMIQVLQDNGVDAAKCGDQTCHLSMAREIKAEKFLSGAIQWLEGEFTASIRLIDTGTGRIMASVRLEGETVKSLRKAFDAKSQNFFRQGGLLATQPSLAPAPAPAPVATPSPAPAPTPVPASTPTPAPVAASSGCDSTCQYLMKSCNEGEPQSCYSLGSGYKYGNFGLPKDSAKANQVFASAAIGLARKCDSGSDVNSCLTLSNMYMTGEGVPQDEAKSTSLAHGACERGSAPGCMMTYSHKEQSYAIGRLRTLCDKGDDIGCSYLTVDSDQKAYAIETLKKRCESGMQGACPYYEVHTKH